MDWPGVYRLGGADFTYKRPYNEPESLETDGPLGEDLILEVSRVTCGGGRGGGMWVWAEEGPGQGCLVILMVATTCALGGCLVILMVATTCALGGCLVILMVAPSLFYGL